MPERYKTEYIQHKDRAVFMRRVCLLLLALLVGRAAVAAPAPVSWYERDHAGEAQVYLYFFWSKKCPHCLTSLPYLEMMAEDYPWLHIKRYQLVGNEQNVQRYEILASSLGKEARSVPGFVFCKQMLTGFDAAVTPDLIIQRLQHCREHLSQHADLGAYEPPGQQGFGELIRLNLPFIGTVASGVDSLPYLTVAIAAVDAFNPCAFFVLMFLLSMMLHTGSRRRMLLVGGIFVLISGLVYFLFMSAWLNLFRVIGQLDAITIAAALVAIAIGLINVKDYFWFKKGVSLSIPDQAKPGMYERTRALLQAKSVLTLSLAAAGLALFANLYEFLCTAGFPMVYTRILTLSELPLYQYYSYLAFYNLIYILPLLFIVIVFAISLGNHKLQQSEGRGLKLIAGAMMLSLGTVLLIAPNVLHNVVATLGLMVFAVCLSIIIILIDKKRSTVDPRSG